MARRAAKQPTRRGIVPKAVDTVLAHLPAAEGARKTKAPTARVVLAGGRAPQRRAVAGGVAEALGRGMFSIDLSGAVSKYIGETEKNLAALFDMVEASGSILFFDEADALFGKRSTVKDSHDRYANLDAAYLRKRIKAFRGVLVMGTDDGERLDPAFRRDVDLVVTVGRGTPNQVTPARRRVGEQEKGP